MEHRESCGWPEVAGGWYSNGGPDVCHRGTVPRSAGAGFGSRPTCGVTPVEVVDRSQGTPARRGKVNYLAVGVATAAWIMTGTVV